MRVFVLDDEVLQAPRNAIIDALKDHDLTLATSVADAVGKWHGPYELILLDHDMRGYYESSHVPHSGYQFVKWLLKNKMLAHPRPEVVLHSQNAEGRKNTGKLLNQYGIPSLEFPFSDKYVTMLSKL